MGRSLIEDALAHHTWATSRLIDACAELTPEQLAKSAPGTYGPILETLRHIVVNDCWDLFVFGVGSMTAMAEAERADLAGLRAANERNEAEWARLLAAEPDADAVFKETDPDDGYERDATAGIRLAYALQHGNEHRAQVSATLATLGIAPPDVSVFAFGLISGTVTERFPSEGGQG
jgi:uncharacterized damage-inducible protein DinB